MNKNEEERKVHVAVGSGRWFPGDAKILERDVEGYIRAAEVPVISGRVVAAFAPHAGYRYSGKVAGYAFRAIRDTAVGERKPDCVVVLGFTHREAFSGVALLDGDALVTPLGETRLDRDAADVLVVSSERIRFDSRPHLSEHSAENEIPFLQVALPGVPMVVALMGDHDGETIDALVEGLDALNRQKRVLVVSSTDMLHDPDYDRVTQTDKQTLELVERMDYKALMKAYSGARQTFCGICPVLTAMRFAEMQGVKRGLILHYRNCGDDFPESRGQWVVGYGASVFVAE